MLGPPGPTTSYMHSHLLNVGYAIIHTAAYTQCSHYCIHMSHCVCLSHDKLLIIFKHNILFLNGEVMQIRSN